MIIAFAPWGQIIIMWWFGTADYQIVCFLENEENKVALYKDNCS